MDSPFKFGGMIDAEKLIRAVRARRALYSRNDRYSAKHRHARVKLWRDVCREVHSGFDEMSGTDKLEYEREVLKRWRSLRTCFSREVALQKREKLKGVVKRRKRYEHFDALNFLLPEYEDDQEDTNKTLHFESGDESAEVDEFEESSRSDGETLRQVKSEIEIENFPETEFTEPERQHDTLEYITRKEENDSDKLFFLSLLPSFKTINPKRKLAAKIELMKVLESFQED